VSGPNAQANKGLNGLSVMASWRSPVTLCTFHMDGKHLESDSECLPATARHEESGSSIMPLSGSEGDGMIEAAPELRVYFPDMAL
jgi:hypothetical protein